MMVPTLPTSTQLASPWNQRAVDHDRASAWPVARMRAPVQT